MFISSKMIWWESQILVAHALSHARRWRNDLKHKLKNVTMKGATLENYEITWLTSQ